MIQDAGSPSRDLCPVLCFLRSTPFFFFVVVVVAISWATLPAYGGSQARDRIRAVAAGLHQSHSNVGSEPCLHPTPQLTAMPDH